MRILVTGGAGFVGSHIVDRLIASGHEVRVLDALLPLAHRTTPEYLEPAAEYVYGDVIDPEVVDRSLRGIDAVCHQAAMVGLGVDMGDAPAYVRHNDLGTAVLLRALAQRRFAGRLVLASSMVVYGEGGYRCDRHGPAQPAPRRIADLEAGRFEVTCPGCGGPLLPEAVRETRCPDPRNIYAATKLHQEHLCAAFARESGATVIALRYHNVYGPRMPRDTPYAGVASIFASALADDRAPRVFEDGGQRRDFVHVRDVARANVAALTTLEAAPPGSFDAVNVASGQPRTIREMAEALADAHGPSAPRPVLTGEFRLGDVRHIFASSEKASTRLGFTVEEEFAAGMAEFAHASLRSPA
jgi:dTDP-L-rhamnose 4-epimerase